MTISSEVNNKELKKNYTEACKDTKFRRLIKTLGVDEEIAMRYTSNLESTVCELNNCSKCDGLIYCKNRLEGHVFYPDKFNNQVIFSYVPCKYQKELKEKENNRQTREKDILAASFTDIDISDKKRVKVIKWLKEFYDKYDKNGNFKGLYLHGNFGCGKTYLVSALFNELSKKRISTEIVYFPELLRDIKSDFDSYADRIEYLENVDLLLIDDIGAEKVTEWSRDEILGTILQKRMNNYKATFFTSNLNIEELEKHLRTSDYSDDEIKARRIIERVKQLTEDLELISENKRK
jgi:primosomal protein DnaI